MRREPRPPHRRLRRVQRLQRAQEMHEIPRLIGLQLIGERGHRRAVESGHEDPVQVLVGFATHEAGTRLEIVRTDGIVLAVRQRLGGWAVPVSRRPVTLPAFQVLKQLPAAQNALDRRRGLGRNRDRPAGLCGPPARRERLDVRDEVDAVLWRERDPGRHVGRDEAPRHRIEEILIRGQRARRRRAALENPQREIAGLGIDPLRIFALRVALVAVTARAIPRVQRLPARRVSRFPGNVRLLRGPGQGRCATEQECGATSRYERQPSRERSHRQPPLKKRSRSRGTDSGSRSSCQG